MDILQKTAGNWFWYCKWCSLLWWNPYHQNEQRNRRPETWATI